MDSVTEQKKSITKAQYQKFKSIINLDVLPEDISISTMTITCKFDSKIICENVGEYMELSKDRILAVKFGDKFSRSLIEPKKKGRKKKAKKKRCFYNQVTVVVKPTKGNPINIKLFKNGSIQMTGCKNVKSCIDVLEKLCSELRKVRAIICPETKSRVILKPFVEKKEEIDVDKLKDVQIRMINSNFHIGFKIDREALYELLLKDGVECSYEPIVHACVNIKYNYNDEKKVSVFVFESGSVIITGANKSSHIKDAYSFINKKLYDNYSKILNIGDVISKKNIVDEMKAEADDEMNFDDLAEESI